MEFDKVLANVCKKNKIRLDSFENFLLDLSALGSKHATLIENVTTTVNEMAFNGSKNEADEFWYNCPDCNCKTLVNYENCHVCGVSLIAGEEEIVEKPKKKTTKKKQSKKVSKKSPVKEEVEAKTEELDDDLNLDEFEEGNVDNVKVAKTSETTEDIDDLFDDLDDIDKTDNSVSAEDDDLFADLDL